MPPLVEEGLNLAMYGMGTVFVFLTLLVFATMTMSRLVAPAESESAMAGTTGPDQRKMAAISAAIHQHRSKTSK